jgi:hypothetical protein
VADRETSSFRITGTFLTEAHSAPPGAFPIPRSRLDVKGPGLVLAPRRMWGWTGRGRLLAPLPRISRVDRSGGRGAYLEWTDREGEVPHGAHLEFESEQERDRFLALLDRCSPGAAGPRS